MTPSNIMVVTNKMDTKDELKAMLELTDSEIKLLPRKSLIGGVNDGKYEDAHLIRLSAYDGGSVNPRINHKLTRQIKRSLKDKCSFDFIKNVLHKYKRPNSDEKQFLLQLRWREVFIICTARSKSQGEVKKNLLDLFNRFHVHYVRTALHQFDYGATIETIVPQQRPYMSKKTLEHTSLGDAKACHCQTFRIIDFDKGAVNFICHPLKIEDAKALLRAKEYKIFHAEYHLKAKKFVKLSQEENEEFELLLEELREAQGIESVHDNVRRPQVVAAVKEE